MKWNKNSTLLLIQSYIQFPNRRLRKLWCGESNVETCYTASGLSCLVTGFNFLAGLVFQSTWAKRTVRSQHKQKACRYRKNELILLVVSVLSDTYSHFSLWSWAITYLSWKNWPTSQIGIPIQFVKSKSWSRIQELRVYCNFSGKMHEAYCFAWYRTQFYLCKGKHQDWIYEKA